MKVVDSVRFRSIKPTKCTISNTRWFKYDRDWLRLVYK